MEVHRVAVAPAGETRLVATLPLGAPGYNLSLTRRRRVAARSLRTPGRCRVEADRTRWSALRNDPSLGLGPTARLVLQLGIVTPWAEAATLWTSTARLPLATRRGTRSERAGLFFGRRFMFSVDGAHAATGSGERWEASTGVHLHLG